MVELVRDGRYCVLLAGKRAAQMDAPQAVRVGYVDPDDLIPDRIPGIGYLDDGTKIIARASVCATGVDYRKLGLPNEDRLFGAGVYYGAGVSEAMLCSRQEVYLVGGSNSVPVFQ